MITPLSLPENFELSDEFKKCFDEIEGTSKSAYITGVAGSGKSTWLNYFRRNSKKNLVVLAPTGIAALNIQGETIHSFLKLPHRLIQREDVQRLWADGLFEKLDTVILDEASMIRPDLLDAVDLSLRLNKNRLDIPFGGVQILLIGDLFQLPPIVERELAEHFSELYDSKFFFSANIFKEAKFHSFTFTKNYRQKDEKFLSLLNKVRDNTITVAELRVLNERVDSHLAETVTDCMRLVPTNALANAINQMRLERLPGKEFLYRAVISGEYEHDRQPRSLPADELLRLRIGAQVLMVKNDPDKRWVNGQVGKIVELAEDGMKVQIGHGVYDLHPVTWKKFAYRHNGATGRIEHIEVGSFEQYPVKLGWAITIHKSQGLTFDRVVVDLGNGVFDHGQTYVALSRCRSLESLILKRPVRLSDLIFDRRIERVSKLFKPIEASHVRLLDDNC